MIRECYKVVSQDSSHELSCCIAGYLNTGWSLVGGVATGIANPASEIPKLIYCQALARTIETTGQEE